jgi:hypothetical protein
MAPGESYILLEDHYSMFHLHGSAELLAKKGERLTIISEHGDVLIVKTQKDKTFSITKNKLIQ